MLQLPNIEFRQLKSAKRSVFITTT